MLIQANETVGVEKTTNLQLGDTQIGVVEWTPLGAPQDDPTGGAPYRFLNLHQNENCSVAAIKVLLQAKQRGSVFYFNKTLTSNGLATRNVTFSYRSAIYTFDPNRMFTSVGIQANLWPYNADAASLVLSFGQQVLKLYTAGLSFQWVAIHNNAITGGLSAAAYLPGGAYGNDATQVNIGSIATPKEFFLFTDTPHCRSQYQKLASMGFSTVLQAPVNSSLSDDGSLSYYCAVINQDYVNIEGTAPTPQDHEGFQIVTQFYFFLNLWSLL